MAKETLTICGKEVNRWEAWRSALPIGEYYKKCGNTSARRSELKLLDLRQEAYYDYTLYVAPDGTLYEDSFYIGD